MGNGKKCPYCGSSRVMIHDHDRSDDKLVNKCHCHECNKSFNMVYDLTFLYCTNDLGSKI